MCSLNAWTRVDFVYNKDVSCLQNSQKHIWKISAVGLILRIYILFRVYLPRQMRTFYGCSVYIYTHKHTHFSLCIKLRLMSNSNRQQALS
jgi:hypothetical protein